MRIGIETTWLGHRPAGVGTMVGEVIDELEGRQDVELFLIHGGSGPLKHWRIYKQLKERQLDVLWQVGGWLPLLMPRGLKTIQTVHDLISFDNPEWFPQSGLSRWWSQTIRVKRALRRATWAHCVSEWTWKQLLRHAPHVKDRAFVAHQGVCVPHERGGELADPVPRPYVLVLGTIEPRKNIAFACEVFEQFAREYEEPHFVVVGGTGWKVEESLQALRELQEQFPGRVHHLGYVHDQEKWRLLEDAGALLITSHAEGFGRPALEAMSVDTPVIAPAHSALEEIATDAAIMVPPGDTKKTARALWRALYHDVLKERLIPLGRKRAEQFTVCGMVDTVLSHIQNDAP